ncbi:interleukin-17 receptor D-like isoform X2 [Entelurus aequoreus]|uniref:interleukin-17 receptor D-like isoform X2 n=1 Tax=Entelurus aequoreus TaxID=161455 RepID=UPI002B1DA9CF|nr:interleukin-17 receptor D-like isoform X2 [Entelurus aequoreus]
MSTGAFLFCSVLTVVDLQSWNSEKCSLRCIRQRGPGCQYCRISNDEVDQVLGLKYRNTIGTCTPWPCFELLAEDDPHLCEHFVEAPNDIEIDLRPSSDPHSDAVVISWKPSEHGIDFLRGFQVSLKSLRGSDLTCQLFLLQTNLTLPASHAEKRYKSDVFSGLSLGSKYAVTVMALPVPREWEKFYRSRVFSTRSMCACCDFAACEEKTGVPECKAEWHPQYVDVQQKNTVVIVTFNLAPPILGITSYFCICTANGKTTSTDIIPNVSRNKTHHSFALRDLEEGSNYTCEVAASQVDAVRKQFNVYVKKRATTGRPYWSLAFLFFFVWVLTSVVTLAVLKKKYYSQTRKTLMEPEEGRKMNEKEPHLPSPSRHTV